MKKKDYLIILMIIFSGSYPFLKRVEYGDILSVLLVVSILIISISDKSIRDAFLKDWQDKRHIFVYLGILLFVIYPICIFVLIYFWG